MSSVTASILEIPAPADYAPGSFEGMDRALGIRLEEVAQRYADRPAATHRNETLTYRELNASANRLAHAILAHPHAENVPTVMLLGHELSSVVAMLGVIKAGRPFSIFDPGAPIARLQKLLDHLEPDCLVSTRQFASIVDELATGRPALPIVYLDELDPALLADHPGRVPALDSPFAVLYTSGSTGEPKGVIHSQRLAIHQMRGQMDRSRFAPSDRKAMLTSFSAGAAYFQVLPALLSGALLCLFDLRRRGPDEALKWIAAEQLTLLNLTPSVFRSIFEQAPPDLVLPALRVIGLSGEAARVSDVQLFKAHTAPHCMLTNLMGGSEAVGMTYLVLDHASEVSGEFLSTGYPMPDRELLLVDDDGQPVKPGEPGEIVIRSAHMATGYWKQPELTAQRFRPDPDRPGVWFCYTGDLGRIRPDGMLEFMGRKDFMVKIRGQRVELGEIETALRRHAVMQEAVVVARPSRIRPDQQQLVAYVVPKPGTDATTESLRKHVEAMLPEYMVPSYFVFVERLPLTASGKVDRRALPDPPERAELTADEQPADELESRLAAIWAHALKLERVGVHDNFFEHGGDSLSVLSMLVDVEKDFGRVVPQTFFRTPTIRGLASLLREPAPEPAVLPDDKFAMEGRHRVGGRRKGTLASPLRRWAVALRRELKTARKRANEASLFERALARSTRSMTLEEARAFLLATSRRSSIVPLVYALKRRLFQRFLQSMGLPDSERVRFPGAVATNLLYNQLERLGAFRHRGASVFSADLERLLASSAPAELERFFSASGLEIVQAGLREKRGVILISFHGSPLFLLAFRVMARWLGGEKIHGVTHKMALRHSVYDGYAELMPGGVAGSVYAEIAFYGMKILQRGGIVFVAGDTFAPGPGRTHHIRLGDRLYEIKPGFAELALNTGATVIPSFGRFLEDGRMVIEFLPPLDPGRGTREEQIGALVRQYEAFVNETLRKYPDMLFWKRMATHLRRRA